MVAMRFVKVYGGLTRAIEPISKTVDSEDKEARIDRINDTFKETRFFQHVFLSTNEGAAIAAQLTQGLIYAFI
jgi:hypothetical protein